MQGLISWVDVYYMLTRTQRIELDIALNRHFLSCPKLHMLPMEVFKEITKNQKTIESMVQLKRQHFELLKVG